MEQKFNRTKMALIARGVDSKTADNLIKSGFSLNSLKIKTKQELKKLGLDEAFINIIHNEVRPPIPNDILTKLLFNNRFQCCVCRDPKLPIVVHHIEEWAQSRSHNLENLAVLCLNHHDLAHSKKELSQNLDEKTLRSLKKEWENKVKIFDQKAILNAMRFETSNWDYINVTQLYRLINEFKIDLSLNKHYRSVLSAGLIQEDGYPTFSRTETMSYRYEGNNCILYYEYMKENLHNILNKLSIINISDYLDKGSLAGIVEEGDFVFVQGAHYFSKKTEKYYGMSQECHGLRKVNNVEITFVFDLWDATSMSAKCEWLSGRKNESSILKIKNITKVNGKLIIQGSVLAIGHHWSKNLKIREYSPY